MSPKEERDEQPADQVNSCHRCMGWIKNPITIGQHGLKRNPHLITISIAPSFLVLSSCLLGKVQQQHGIRTATPLQLLLQL